MGVQPAVVGDRNARSERDFQPQFLLQETVPLNGIRSTARRPLGLGHTSAETDGREMTKNAPIATARPPCQEAERGVSNRR